MPDIFRHEPTNIGLILQKNFEFQAKFVEEDVFKNLECTKHTKRLDIYSQWVEYWRRVISRPIVSEADLFVANGGNFNIVLGGEAQDDDLKSTMDYLFSLLVSDVKAKDPKEVIKLFLDDIDLTDSYSGTPSNHWENMIRKYQKIFKETLK